MSSVRTRTKKRSIGADGRFRVTYRALSVGSSNIFARDSAAIDAGPVGPAGILNDD